MGNESNGSPFEHTARVSQAVGIVSVQAGCGVERALDLMRARATTARVTMDELATFVIDGSTRFD